MDKRAGRGGFPPLAIKKESMEVNNENIRKILGKNIRKYRKVEKLTQEQLAELSDISTEFIKDIEAERSGISLSTLINICKVLKITPNQLLKEFFESDESEKIIEDIRKLDKYKQRAIETLIEFFYNSEDNL